MILTVRTVHLLRWLFVNTGESVIATLRAFLDHFILRWNDAVSNVIFKINSIIDFCNTHMTV